MRKQVAWAFLLALLITATAAWAQYTGTAGGPAAPAYAIPEGTQFIVRLEDKLDTRKVERGKRFKAKLAEDLTAPNGDFIPRGKKLKGHVSDVDHGLRGKLLLSFDEIETQHGWVPLVATVMGSPGEHGVQPGAGPEGEISRPGVDKRRAAEAAAIGAGVGGLTGAVAGGSKGAAIGAAVGAGAGLGAGILTGRGLTLEKGQQLELRLDRALVVPQR